MTDNKATRLLLILIAGLAVGYASCFLFDLARVDAQGVGLFARPDCTTVTAPVTGSTWCFDSTSRVLKVWDGGAFATATITNKGSNVTRPSSGFFTNKGGSSPFTQVHVVPWNGNLLLINGVLETIPAGVAATSGGVIADYNNATIDGTAGQTLAINTTYYVYAFMNAGVMTLEFSTTGRAQDATYGHEIKSGNSTRSLVGLVRTNAASKFVGTNNQQLTLSWFNQVRMQLYVSVVGSVASGVWSEPNSANRLEWVQWNFEIPNVYVTAAASNTSANQYSQVAVGFDSATTPSGHLAVFKSVGANDIGEMVAHAITASSSEGYHFASFLMQTGGVGTATTTNGIMWTSPLRS